MPFTEQDVLDEVGAITQAPGWQQPEKRGEFVRDVAVKTRGGIEPDFHSAVIGKLWDQVDDRGWARQTSDFVGKAVGEVVKSMPALGGAVAFAAGDAVGLSDSGSGSRLKQGVKTLTDATGQRLKQAMPGASEQSKRDDMLEALRGDLSAGALPPEFDQWLGGEYDNTDIPAAVKPLVDGLVSGYGRQAVLADHGEVTPEKLRAWQETDRNPGRSGGDIPGQPGPRELLADYAATKDPASWAAFKSLVTETDAQHEARLRNWTAGRESARTMKAMPEGLMKELTGRSLDMQGSPIDLATALLPALRGAKALNAARKGGLAAAAGNVAAGAAKEAVQEGGTELLSDSRSTAGQIAEAAAMGAVGSGVLEGGMGAVGAGLGRLSPDLQTPVAAAEPLPVPSAGAVSPLGDIAAGTFVPEAGVPTRQPLQPILGNVPDAVLPPAPVNTAAAVPEFNAPANIQEPVTVPDVQSGLSDPGLAEGDVTQGLPVEQAQTESPARRAVRGEAATIQEMIAPAFARASELLAGVRSYWRDEKNPTPSTIAIAGREFDTRQIAPETLAELKDLQATLNALPRGWVWSKNEETWGEATKEVTEPKTKLSQGDVYAVNPGATSPDASVPAADKTSGLAGVPPAGMAVLQRLNEELPETARAKWTPEVYAKAGRFFESGKESELEGLTPIQKRRVMMALLETDEKARTEQERADRKGEHKIRSQEKRDAAFEKKTTFKNLTIDRDLEAGFMSTAGVDALFDLANAAITAGRTFVQWSAEMVKRFGDGIREYLAHVWAVAKDSLPTTAAQNVRLGGPAKGGPVRLSQSGAVINLIPALKGGTKVFHAKGEPFRVNYLGARELLTGSPLPAELVPVLTRTQQEKKALEQRAAQLGRDLQTAIDQEVDRTGRTPELVNEQVAKMMGGDVQVASLLSAAAPVLHERTRAVRVLLDNLSTAVGQTLPTGDLRTTIMGNLGAWLRRSYAAFDPASGWNYDALLRHAAAGTQINGKDAAKILNDARAHLRAQNPQAQPQHIEADLRDLMDRDVWERELTGSGAKKSTSSLMRRKDIAPEIRAVMGEEQNPVKLLTSSSGFQAQFIARHHGQVAMRNAGLATGLFATKRGGVYTEQIPVNDRAWSGFNGVWTTPQMLKALDNASGVLKEGSDLGGIIVSTLKALGNKAKLNRVALNPDSWMVNMLGNVTSLIQNGDVFAWSIIRRVAEAREITGAGDAKSGRVVNAAAEALQDASRDMMARLTESGVLGSSLTLADIEASLPRHLLQWLATDQKYDRAAGALEGAIVGQGMGRGLGLPGRAAGGAVGAVAGALAGGVKIQGWQQLAADFLMTKPDALARTTGWLTNYETGLASGMAPDAASAWATKRTLNTFPNYAALPGLMREASKLGIMGSFIAFQHEVYRNFGWNVRYAAEELNSGNAALIQRGLQRLAGIGAIAGLAGGGLAAILAATGVAGGDDERNKLFRKWFGAPWEKDAVLAFREFDAEKVSYFNTSYILPQTTMAELLQAMREGENPADAAGRVADRLYEQFIGSSVHLGPILDALANKKRTGVPLTYQTGVAGAAERADHPLKTILEPGFAEKIERLTYAMREAERNGVKYSIEQEFHRVIGLREQTKTWPKMVEGVYRNLAEENSNIRAQANREISLNRPGASKRAVDAANAQIDALRQKLGDFERDALKLGVPEQVIIRAKREASVGKLPNVGLQVDGKRVISLGK